MTAADAPAWTRRRAPGSLGLVQEFLNTHAYSGRPDSLVEPDGPWAQLTGLDVGGLDEGDLRRLRGVREALREMLLSGQVDPVLTTEARGAQVALQVGGSGCVEMTARGMGVDHYVAELLVTLARATADGSLQRLKVCAGDACRVAFWDESRNRVSRFCPSGRCGTRARQRDFRARHRTLLS